MGWGSLKPLAGRGLGREWRSFEGDGGGTAAVFIALAAMVLASAAGLAFDTCATLLATGIFIDGIIIAFTIAHGLKHQTIERSFESCCSGAARCFKAPHGNQLIDALGEIGSDQSTLRRAQ